MAVPRRTGAIGVFIDDRKVQTMLEGYIKTIPKAADIGARKVAAGYALSYLQEMETARGRGGGLGSIEAWTGRSFESLRQQMRNPIRLAKGQYGVVVTTNLVFLDQMKTHKVKLRIGSPIQRWAKRKLGLKGGAKKSITVHGHPWIQNANRRARKNITLVRKELRRALKRKGK